MLGIEAPWVGKTPEEYYGWYGDEPEEDEEEYIEDEDIEED